jgi:hypothetical protein
MPLVKLISYSCKRYACVVGRMLDFEGENLSGSTGSARQNLCEMLNLSEIFFADFVI